MALASLSRSLLSKMSLSGPSSGSTPSSAPSTSIEGGPLPLSVVGGNGREGSVGTEDHSYLSSGFLPIRNMELYPPRAKVIEEGCANEECPLPLLSGESVEYMCALVEAGVLYLTNYRLIATLQEGYYSVPLGMVEGIEMQAVKETLIFLCRDARKFRLAFPSPLLARSFLSHIQASLHPPADYRNIFAFIHEAYQKDLQLSGLASIGGAGLGRERSSGGGAGLGKKGTGPGKGPPLLTGDDLVNAEYHRLGMSVECSSGHTSSGRGHTMATSNGIGHTSGKTRAWRISQCNSKYEVSATYPKLLVVPGSVSDEELLQVAKFRMLGRLPVVVWRHPCTGSVIARSSQPLVGVLSWRSAEDEKMLQAFSLACWQSRELTSNTALCQNHFKHGLDTSLCSLGNGVQPGSWEFPSAATPRELEEDSDRAAPPRLVVMDLRSYAATLGNRAKGGGSECTDYYPNCDVQFKGLPNIHSVRKSFQLLRNTLASEDQTSFLSSLESSQWLSYLCQLVGVACEVVGVVHDSASPVLIHCSDGWDRTTQVVALALLMLDPYYRTVQGFQVLVEREWLAFGHKFGDRCGHSSEDTNQRSPVFLQWLDCVHQLTRQCPCDFQFNELFLLKLGCHVYSCLFGTLLGNSMKEREAWRIGEDTASLWHLLHQDNVHITNYLYQPPARGELKVLKPVASIQSMLLWKAMYCDPLLSPYSSPKPPAMDSNSLEDLDRGRPAAGGGVSEGAQLRAAAGGGGNLAVSEEGSQLRAAADGGMNSAQLQLTAGRKLAETGGVKTSVDAGSTQIQGAPGRTQFLDSVRAGSVRAGSVDKGSVDKGSVASAEQEEMVSSTVLACNGVNGRTRGDDVCNGGDCADTPSSASTGVHRVGGALSQSGTLVSGAVNSSETDSPECDGETLLNGGGDVVQCSTHSESGASTGGNGTPVHSVGSITSAGELPETTHPGGGEAEPTLPAGGGRTETTHPGDGGLAETTPPDELLPVHLPVLAGTCKREPPHTTRSSLRHLTERDSHEHLHVRRSESSSASSGLTQEATPLGEKTTPIMIDKLTHGDEYLTTSPRASAVLEMFPIPNKASSLNTGLSEAVQDGGWGHQEGVTSFDGGVGMQSSPTPIEFRFQVDVDGLPCFHDSVHQRLKQLEAAHKERVSNLQQRLREAKRKVALAVKCDCSQLDQLVGPGEEEGETAERDATESVSSIASWDYVDEDGEGVRWIPDHAAVHCFGCGREFWTARRKHHCRSCGKVFCGACSDFFCQVPQEQLFEDVRVCEKCFYKLDGHLQQKSAQGQAPA